MAVVLHASPWERKITVTLACISIGIMLDKMRLANEEQGRGKIVHDAFLRVDMFWHNSRTITRWIITLMFSRGYRIFFCNSKCFDKIFTNSFEYLLASVNNVRNAHASIVFPTRVHNQIIWVIRAILYKRWFILKYFFKRIINRK